MTETAIKAAIMRTLLKRGGFFFRAAASQYSRAGISDILGCYRGCFIALEVKTPEAYRKKDCGASESQVHFIQSVLCANGYATVVSTLAQVDAFLDNIDRDLDGE